MTEKKREFRKQSNEEASRNKRVEKVHVPGGVNSLEKLIALRIVREPNMVCWQWIAQKDVEFDQE